MNKYLENNVSNIFVNVYYLVSSDHKVKGFVHQQTKSTDNYEVNVNDIKIVASNRVFQKLKNGLIKS